MTETNTDTPAPSHSLDPTDWEAFREIGHAMLDDMIDYQRDVRNRPAWQSPSQESRDALSSPVPRGPHSLEGVYERFKQHVLPYPTGNIHPRFWGWVMGNGTPVGMLADLLGGAMNCHVSGYDQGAAILEHQVIRWLAELMGFPLDSSGLLVSGGTMANLVGVTVARNAGLGQSVRKDGVHPDSHGLAVYGSTQTHGWAKRTCDLLGLGEDTFRQIPVDNDHRIDVSALDAAIEADRRNGIRPICIIGNAGTVACGASDDLNALADLAASQRIWFHVDGAFGALAKLSPKFRHLVAGLERADSLAFDLHKWGYMQYEIGVVLVRNANLHSETFAFSCSYLEQLRGGIGVNPTEFASRGIQLSRGFRSLKAWMQLSVYGTDRIGQIVEQNIEDVAHLRRLIAAHPHLEQLGPSVMNVVCFRYTTGQLSEDRLNDLNAELLVRIQESGLAVPSSARIEGAFAIRVAHTNHRTVRRDFDEFIAGLLSIAEELLRAPSTW